MRGTTVPTLSEKLTLVTRGALPPCSTVVRMVVRCSMVSVTPPVCAPPLPSAPFCASQCHGRRLLTLLRLLLGLLALLLLRLAFARLALLLALAALALRARLLGLGLALGLLGLRRA